jgi:hypothetical protein
MKTCKTCGVDKGAEEFRPNRPSCRECERAACRVYGTANRAKRNARLSRWRKTNPDKAAVVDRRKRLRKYGLSEMDRADMEEAQGGKCLLCRRPVPLVIDHEHASGMALP